MAWFGALGHYVVLVSKANWFGVPGTHSVKPHGVPIRRTQLCGRRPGPAECHGVLGERGGGEVDPVARLAARADRRNAPAAR